MLPLLLPFLFLIAQEKNEKKKKPKIRKKITIATEGLLDYIVKRLRSLEGKMTRNDILAYLDSLRKPEADKVWFYGYEMVTVLDILAP
jgi:hypothetical protein